MVLAGTDITGGGGRKPTPKSYAVTMTMITAFFVVCFFVFGFLHRSPPDITIMVDWALKINN